MIVSIVLAAQLAGGAIAPPKSRGVDISRLAPAQQSDANAVDDVISLDPAAKLSIVDPIERTNASALANAKPLSQVDALVPDSATADEAFVEQTVSVADPKSCIRVPDMQSDLTFDIADNRRDAKIRALMDSGKIQIVVNLSAPENRDATPSGMANWLQAVQAGGGRVDTLPIECVRKRGLFKAIGAIFRVLAGPPSRNRIYDAAREYEATLYYDNAQQLVRQVVFRRRIK